MNPRPFIVLALGRSRTAWLSQFLTYGPWVCGHDEATYWRSEDDIRSWWMQPWIGSAETALAGYWRLLDHFVPGCRVVTIRRPVAEVVESIRRVGFATEALPQLMHRLRYLDAKLDQIEARVPGVLSVQFHDLGAEGPNREVFEFCLGMGWDRQWWLHWRDTNVQVNWAAKQRYFAYHRPQLRKMAELGAELMKAQLAGERQLAKET